MLMTLSRDLGFKGKTPRIGQFQDAGALYTFIGWKGKPKREKPKTHGGLSPRGHLERQAELHASTQDEA